MKMYHTVSQLLNNPRNLAYLNDQYMQEFFKFRDHDIQFLKLFWQPNFDDIWVLLDEPFIEAWLIIDTNLNLNQLYQHILFKLFHKDVDYKLSCDDNDTSMYMVKGYCLKSLCIMCNKIFRDFFMRLARVAHMLIIEKSINDSTIQIKLNNAAKKINLLNQKTDNLTFLIEDIINERVDDITKKIVPNAKCEEVINIVKLPEPFNASPCTPVHLRYANYVVIRCLMKNYDKHLNKIKSYINGTGIIEEMFSSPVANKGIDIVGTLKDAGVKTYRSNGIANINCIDLLQMVKNILM